MHLIRCAYRLLVQPIERYLSLILIAKGPSKCDLIELSLVIYSNSLEPDLTENGSKNDDSGD
jgi:hypothetical protein